MIIILLPLIALLKYLILSSLIALIELTVVLEYIGSTSIFGSTRIPKCSGVATLGPSGALAPPSASVAPPSQWLKDRYTLIEQSNNLFILLKQSDGPDCAPPTS